MMHCDFLREIAKIELDVQFIMQRVKIEFFNQLKISECKTEPVIYIHKSYIDFNACKNKINSKISMLCRCY